ERRGVEVELHDVGLAHAARRQRRRHQEAILAFGMADADVAEAVDHTLAVENAIGGDEIVDDGAKGAKGDKIGWGLRPHVGAERWQHDQGEATECPAKAADGSAHHRLHLQSKRRGPLRYRPSTRAYLIARMVPISGCQWLEAALPAMAG